MGYRFDQLAGNVGWSWTPDGRTIAFATDRGPGTDFEQLTYAPTRIALMDAETGAIRILPLFEGPKHINPQWTPDGLSLYFVADRHGFSDIYRTSLADGTIYQVTRLATGVSGISALSPALSVARESGSPGATATRLRPEDFAR